MSGETGGSSGGREAVLRHAPRAAAALAGLEAGAWSAMQDADRLALAELAFRVVAAQHGKASLTPPPGADASPWREIDAARWRDASGLGPEERAALVFAEQVAFDVASLGEAERDALLQALGPVAFPFAQAVYVADWVPRVRGALDALFGDSDWRSGPDDEVGAGLQEAFDELIRSVPQLTALDPVLTEGVRLRGARHHRCRLCQSLRSRSALVAGADESFFQALEEGAVDSFSPPQRAALAFTDALVASPCTMGSEVVGPLARHFEPAARAELVLDIARNATNKVAVALAADAPHVESGYEVYDVGPDGELHFGLEAPRVLPT